MFQHRQQHQQHLHQQREQERQERERLWYQHMPANEEERLLMELVSFLFLIICYFYTLLISRPIQGFNFPFKISVLLVSNLQLYFSNFPRISEIGRINQVSDVFFKDGRQTPDWCILLNKHFWRAPFLFGHNEYKRNINVCFTATEYFL